MGARHCKGVSGSILVLGNTLSRSDIHLVPWPPGLHLCQTNAPGSHLNYRVNVGGWLVTEPFIVPALYQKYSSLTYPNGSFMIIDEWKLVEQMKADGSISELENHYNTFIVSSFTKSTF
jgi:glucan 1,3-beta-glucosidase